MRIIYFIFLTTILLFSCNTKGLWYELYSNGTSVFKILPDDILYYDTTQHRSSVEIHEIRLREDFYIKDSLLLIYPIQLICYIDGKKYFWSEHFYRSQSSPSSHINFHFDPACDNIWKFSEGGKGRPRERDTVILYTNNLCNSIEFYHERNDIEHYYDEYYKTVTHFRNYVDTARLAHEILLDPYYLNAIKKSGIPIR